jgi:outer membrane protein OmpA-like peptidoglycan-associated protein
MKKVMIGLIGCSLMAMAMARPQASGRHATGYTPSVAGTTGQTPQDTVIAKDTLPPNTPDTSFRYRGDSTIQLKDSVISLADDAPTAKKDSVPNPPKTDPVKTDPKPDAANTDAKNNAAVATDTTAKDTAADDKAEEQKRELDRRWFISPLLKLQFQDFAMLEKNRKGYLSDANTLPFFQRGNASFAASAYKNITQRLSISADIGLSFGHATSNNVLISQTKSQTYNLLNAAVYYHLISPTYRLQPYVTIGINDIINDKSYPTVPLGIGAKFNSRKIMVLGQITYGQSISSNIASTTMYAVGVYIPIKSKKLKQIDDDHSPYNRNNKDDAKKKDTANKNNGNGVTNNIYITINMDSVLKAKGLLDDNGNPTAGSGRKRNGNDDGDDDSNDPSGSRRRKKPFRSLGLDDFGNDDYKIDSLDGKPILRFVVYFEFAEYGLTSHAFGAIDKVINHLKRSSEFSVEIKGYTDSVGTDQYNNMLSRRRAKMVLDYMNSRGVPTELMKARAYGKDNPVGDNSDPNQAWLNRRAEIVVRLKDLASH